MPGVCLIGNSTKLPIDSKCVFWDTSADGRGGRWEFRRVRFWESGKRFMKRFDSLSLVLKYSLLEENDKEASQR